jgi:lysophospholipase L1-like esterase
LGQEPSASPTPGLPSRARTVPLELVLLLGSILVGLGLSEVAARALGLAPKIGRIDVERAESAFEISPDPSLGYTLKPNYQAQRGISKGIVTNSLGFRDPERTIPKPPGVRRIAMLGDSVVMGYGLHDNQETVPRQLEMLLAPRGVEVLNMGVKGYCTRQEVELFRTKGLGTDPDLVMVVFLANDHFDTNTDVVHRNYAWPRPAWSERMFIASHLFRWLAFRFDLFRFRSELDPDWGMRHWNGPPPSDNVEDGLAMLAGLERTRGFRSVVVVWPVFTDDAILDPPALFEEGGERMKVETIAARHQIPVVRLSDRFRADWRRRRLGGDGRSPMEIYTQADGMHPTAEGAEHTAHILAQVLDDSPGLLPQAGR